jgi:hypothetical protein
VLRGAATWRVSNIPPQLAGNRPLALRYPAPVSSSSGAETSLSTTPGGDAGVRADRIENGGTLEHAPPVAAHESPRTTKLSDRTSDQIPLDEIERNAI